LGTTLSYSTDGGTTFTAIVQLVSIDGPNSEMGSVDTVNLGSTVKTTRPTLKDPGTVDIEVQYDPGDTTHQALDSAHTDKTILTWKETYNYAASGAHFSTYAGYIKSRAISGMEAESNLTGKYSIQLTSEIETT
jgi:hypothetical protein